MSWRTYMRERAGLVKLYAGAIGAVLAVAVAWNQLGWPTPAWSSDLEAVHQRIASVEQFNMDTRALVLNQKWERLFSEISRLENLGRLSPDQLELLTNLRLQKRLTEQQLNRLENE